MQTNILEYLEATAPRLPDKIAYSDGTDNLTFAELSHHARALGSALAQKGYYRRPGADEKAPRDSSRILRLCVCRLFLRAA